MRKSINKTTVIIVLVVFLTLSVGYALFSDTITIEGTATAQGTFDITATCITNLDDTQKELVFETGAYYEEEDNGYENESCTVLDDKVTYSVGLKYPTATKTILIKLTNVGNIDAKFNLEDYIINMDEGYSIKAYNSDTNELINGNIEYHRSFIRASYMIFQKADGTYILDNDDESEEFFEINDESIYVVLKSNESFYIVMNAVWDSYNFEDNVYYVAKQNVKIDWIQAVGN